MEEIRQYLYSVSAAALICWCVSSFISRQGYISKILKLLCGIFLTVTIIKPITDVRFDDLTAVINRLSVDAEIAAFNGEDMAIEEMENIIKQNIKAYIINKANALDAVLEIEVILENMVPAAVTIYGEYSPFAKNSLSNMIAQDLGIPEEAQKWHRQY